MSHLRFETVRSAFRKIGAVKADGTPYAAVRGISVSATGEHFRFWQEDATEHNDSIDIQRAYAGKPRQAKWFLCSQGRKFFEALATAQTEGRAIYGIVNKRAPLKDTDGNSVATGAAPILTALGQPAKGQVHYVNPRTGELRVRFAGLGTEAANPVTPPATDAPAAANGGKSCFVDHAVRVEIETKAVAFVARHYEQRGFAVRSVEKEDVGFDLMATRGHSLPNVYSHTVTACNILRQFGVWVGKCDFLGNP